MLSLIAAAMIATPPMMLIFATFALPPCLHYAAASCRHAMLRHATAATADLLMMI